LSAASATLWPSRRAQQQAPPVIGLVHRTTAGALGIELSPTALATADDLID
jgi:hypothetical protein